MAPKKPASSRVFPSAMYGNFYDLLGVVKAPRTPEEAARTGQLIVRAWTKNRGLLVHAYQQLPTLQGYLKTIPEGTIQFNLLNRTIGMMLINEPGGDDLHQHDMFLNVVHGFRVCLMRTPTQKLRVICDDLGVDIPKDPQAARRAGATVVQNMKMPVHRHRIRSRVDSTTQALRALPMDTPEGKVAKALVMRLVNPKKVPQQLRENSDYETVRFRLSRAVATVPQES